MAAVEKRVRLNADPDFWPGKGHSPLTKVEVDEHGVTLRWADGREGHFHPLWLRDNCLCPVCRHPEAWEKTLDLLTVDPEEKPASARLGSDDELEITWASDGHVSRFPGSWLRQNCYDGWALEARRPQRVLWDGLIANGRPEVDYTAVMQTDEGLRDWLRNLQAYGFCIVTDAPQRSGIVVPAVRRIGFLRETHFGTDYAVESKPNPENVAYTAIELKTHNDLSNCEAPPGIQFLHCIEFEADGGESILVDGFSAAEKLRGRNPAAFELLAQTPVVSRYHDHDWDIRHRAPTIAVDHTGTVQELRVNRQLEAPLDIPNDAVVPFIKAKQALVRLLRDPKQEYRFKLKPGEIMSFHNRRVLHGRAAFDPNSGRRKLEGCYVDCDQAWSRLRVLERTE